MTLSKSKEESKWPASSYNNTNSRNSKPHLYPHIQHVVLLHSLHPKALPLPHQVVEQAVAMAPLHPHPFVDRHHHPHQAEVQLHHHLLLWEVLHLHLLHLLQELVPHHHHHHLLVPQWDPLVLLHCHLCHQVGVMICCLRSIRACL
jgi:hypothetical protein